MFLVVVVGNRLYRYNANKQTGEVAGIDPDSNIMQLQKDIEHFRLNGFKGLATL